jgi:hypothetical protein
MTVATLRANSALCIIPASIQQTQQQMATRQTASACSICQKPQDKSILWVRSHPKTLLSEKRSSSCQTEYVSSMNSKQALLWLGNVQQEDSQGQQQMLASSPYCRQMLFGSCCYLCLTLLSHEFAVTA